MVKPKDPDDFRVMPNGCNMKGSGACVTECVWICSIV